MGRATPSMFRRYADLFSESEERNRQLEVQERRRQWRENQAHDLATMPTSGQAS